MCVTIAAASHRHNTSYHQKTCYHQKASHRHKTGYRLAPGYVLRLYVRRSVCRSVLGIAGICGLLSGVIYPAEAAADSGPVVLAAEVVRSLIQHPEVSEANARVCQAIHRLGLSKAEARPKFDLSITGGRQVLEQIKGQSGRPDGRGASESGFRSVPRTFFNPLGREAVPDEEVSGAHRRDYTHRSRNNIYDGTVSVRYNLVDWGQNSSAIEVQRLRHQVAQLEARATLADRSFQLLSLAIRLAMIEQSLVAQQQTADLIADEVASIEARVRAGAGRLAELREAKLLQLDADIAINRTSAERDLFIERLSLEYDLSVDDAAHYLQVYLQNRPEPLQFLEPAETSQARALRLQIASADYEERQIKGSRYMQIDGVAEGTIFDLADYEDEYEVIARLEFRMPLYDGGTASARLRETAWRSRELESAVQKQHREHAANSELAALQFRQIDRQIEEESARLGELESRLTSVQARQGQTVVAPLAIANLHLQIGRAKTRLIELRMEREEVRGRALFLAEELAAVLQLKFGENGC